MSADDFANEVKFVETIVEEFPAVSNTTGRFALIVFSDTVEIMFDYDDFEFERDAIIAKLQSGDITHEAGKTVTGAAMDMTHSILNKADRGFGDSEDFTSVVIIVTDGRATDESSVEVNAAALHATGAEVFAIGIGSRITAEVSALNSLLSSTLVQIYFFPPMFSSTDMPAANSTPSAHQTILCANAYRLHV